MQPALERIDWTPVSTDSQDVFAPLRRKEIRKPLPVKVPETLLSLLKLIVEVWKLKARESGNAEGQDRIGLTYVVERLLSIGVDTVFGQLAREAGIAMPTKEPKAREAFVRTVLSQLNKK